MQNAEVQNTRPAGSERPAWKRLPAVALLAALLAAVANILVYIAASGLGFIPQGFLLRMPSGEMPFTMSLVAITSFIGAVGAAIVFTLIGVLARRPVRLFRIVAAVALVLSFATPLTIPGAPAAMIRRLR